MIEVDIVIRRPDQDVAAHFKAGHGVTVLFGASGAGKTSILEAIAGLAAPRQGRIMVGGETYFDSLRRIDRPPCARKIGYVPQDLLLFPHMKVADNLLYGAPSRKRLAEIAALCEVNDLLDRIPLTISGGERRRVALARALMADPALLMLDEPLTGLDPARRHRLLSIIERLRDRRGPPILYVSHFAEEAVRLADTAVMMAAGQVVISGAAEDVFADPRAQTHFGLFDQGMILEGRIAALDQDGLHHIEVPGGALALSGQAPGPVGATLRLRILARDIALARAAPQDTSLVNILPAEITALHPDQADCLIDLKLGHGVRDGAMLRARITQYSANRMALRTGERLYALIKAVAIARRR